MANDLKDWECVEKHNFFGGVFQTFRFENTNFPNAYIIQVFNNYETAPGLHCIFSVYKGGKLYDEVGSLKKAIEQAEY